MGENLECQLLSFLGGLYQCSMGSVVSLVVCAINIQIHFSSKVYLGGNRARMLTTLFPGRSLSMFHGHWGSVQCLVSCATNIRQDGLAEKC